MNSDDCSTAEIVPPGVEKPLDECPLAVRLWCWSISHLFQTWQVERLAAVVPGWSDAQTKIESRIDELFGCRPSDLRFVQPDSEMVGMLCEFRTRSANDLYYEFSGYPLLQGPDRYDAEIGFDLGIRLDTRTGAAVVEHFSAAIG
jgi:hypothetical protein